MTPWRRRLLGAFATVAVWAAAWVLLTVWHPAAAQSSDAAPKEAGTPVIAVVDSQYVLRESAAARSVRQQVGLWRESYLARLQSAEDELRHEDGELNRLRASLPQELYADRRNDLQRRVADLRRQLQERKRAIEERLTAAMEQVRAALVETVAEIAEEKGISVVLLKSAIFLAESGLDITEEALARLDERLPVVALESLPDDSGLDLTSPVPMPLIVPEESEDGTDDPSETDPAQGAAEAIPEPQPVPAPVGESASGSGD